MGIVCPTSGGGDEGRAERAGGGRGGGIRDEGSCALRWSFFC